VSKHTTAECINIYGLVSKSCGKGLCIECAAQVDRSLACKTTCIDEVAALNAQIRKARVTLSAQKRYRIFLPSLFMALGTLFIVMDYLDTDGLYYGAIPGAVFFLFGVALAFINRRWAKEM
jgi:hypothetical protein